MLVLTDLAYIEAISDTVAFWFGAAKTKVLFPRANPTIFGPIGLDRLPLKEVTSFEYIMVDQSCDNQNGCEDQPSTRSTKLSENLVTKV